LNNNKLINPKLICAFCWFVLFFNYENARSKKQNTKMLYIMSLDTSRGDASSYVPDVTSTTGSEQTSDVSLTHTSFFLWASSRS